MKKMHASLIRRIRSEWYCHEAYYLPLYGWYDQWQRVLDLGAAALILIVTAPLICLGALLTKLTSRGPVFYSQTRLGRYGKHFTIYKLRTMVHNCERFTGACWAQVNDPRITRVGRILRTLHIDELPQLWNVVRGDMSLIGPRPERPEFLAKLEKAMPHYRRRLLARPGITGLAQVLLPADTELDNVREKLPFDLYYVRHANPWLDLRIALATILYLSRAPIPLRRSVLLLSAAQDEQTGVELPVATYSRYERDMVTPVAKNRLMPALVGLVTGET